MRKDAKKKNIKKQTPYAPAVDRAFDLIELMASAERDLSLSELIKNTNIPRQTLIRILNTLCNRGIVDRTEQRGYYRLGMSLLYLGSRMQEKINFRSIAWPFMQDLSKKTRKTIELATFDRDQLVLIERIEGTEGVRLHSRVGSVFPYLHAICVGKIYLAYMEPQKRRKVLKKIGLPSVTPYTKTDIDNLEKDLQRIIKTGYAFEDQELMKGVRRVAAPIFDFRDELAGCITIAATIFSFETEEKDHFGQLAVDTAKKISLEMGNVA